MITGLAYESAIADPETLCRHRKQTLGFVRVCFLLGWVWSVLYKHIYLSLFGLECCLPTNFDRVQSLCNMNCYCSIKPVKVQQ